MFETDFIQVEGGMKSVYEIIKVLLKTFEAYFPEVENIICGLNEQIGTTLQ